jgi:hypothetical protein
MQLDAIEINEISNFYIFKCILSQTYRKLFESGKWMQVMHAILTHCYPTSIYANTFPNVQKTLQQNRMFESDLY